MPALVNFRPEGRYHLAYFVEFRKLLTLNLVGKEIVDSFFNKDFSPKKIVQIFKEKKIEEDITEEIVEGFLREVKEELYSKINDGYTFLSNTIPSAPISVELQINTKCNLRCKHCFQGSYGTSMSFEKAKKILKILKEVGVFEVNLVGGEVFLHPQFFDILDLCDKYNFATNIVTNGTFLNDENVKKLKKCKNIAVLVSLEGIGEVNDEIRGEGIFLKVDEAIKKLRKNGIYTEISNTLTARNVDYVNQMFEYAESLDLPCNFNLFKPFKDSHGDLVLPPERYFQTGLDITKKKNGKSGLTNAAIMSKLKKDKKRDECRATLIGLSIDVEGKMIPCVSLKEAGYYEGKELPDFDENFQEAWMNDPNFKEFRDIGFRECQARSYIFNNDARGEDPYGIKNFEKYIKSKQSKC